MVKADDSRLLEPRQLRLLELMLETGSVTRAAEALGQSQPNVSLWLDKLRRHFRDPLFVRTARGMEPTPRALALADPVREALQTLRRVSAASRSFVPGEAQRSFRICMTDGSHITLLPRLLKELRVSAPNVRIDTTPIDDGTPRDLEAGRADLALGIVPGLESGFYQQAFYEQDFICLASPAHSSIRSTLTLRAYRDAVHVEVLSGKSYSLLAEALKRHRIERDVVLQLPSFLGLARVVAETDLIATVPREIGETVASNSGLRVLKCPFEVPTFTVKQYWHARMHNDDANRWLRGVCAALYTRR